MRVLTRSLVAGMAMAAGLAGGAVAEEEKVLNVYNWSDYIAEDTIANFEKETGIKVNYDVYDSNEMLEAKLLAGNSGYDIIVPTSTFLARFVQGKIVQPLDKSKIPNFENLDPSLMKGLANNDPGNEHAAIYQWGTNGLGYIPEKVTAALGEGAPVNSWDLIFKPENAKKLADCGIYVLDSPSEIFPITMTYLGYAPDTDDPEAYKKAEELWSGIRPYIKKFHSSEYINALANGDACVAMGFSGDVFIAAARAEEAGKDFTVEYAIPKEGTLMWFDTLAIPADAPHPENAHKFINYILQPQVVGAITNYVSYANAVPASKDVVDPEIWNNPSIFPTDEVKQKLFVDKPANQKLDRLRTRTWNKIKTGA
ncbi:MAG: polyamine ABC transporter substrate-binding protein [Caenispirillum bisanense]|nr:polyamine ABC transporter substrate-binding protein [Caenispirillum bisanense]MCA1972403.1 polyamine ABC transporter substrate-binding protein [Caenispirillum sp.]